MGIVKREGISVAPRQTRKDESHRENRRAKASPEPNEMEDKQPLACKVFTPQTVVNYCQDFDGLNPIHNDPDVAAEEVTLYRPLDLGETLRFSQAGPSVPEPHRLGVLSRTTF